MSMSPRTVAAVEQLQKDLQRLDDAIHHHPVGLAAALSVAITVCFIPSCLMAGAPPVETVLSGLAAGVGTFVAFMIFFRLVGDRLFPDSFGPGRETEPAPVSPRSHGRRRSRQAIRSTRSRTRV
jgi:hypothetical protein